MLTDNHAIVALYHQLSHEIHAHIHWGHQHETQTMPNNNIQNSVVHINLAPSFWVTY
jgi:hypothetical protein